MQTRLPLSPQVFHILLSLATREAHGYAIIQDVEHATEGAIRLGPGTLYSALKRLLADKLVEEVKARPADDDERRRYYRLTTTGRRLLGAETTRLARAVGAARRAGLLRPGAT